MRGGPPHDTLQPGLWAPKSPEIDGWCFSFCFLRSSGILSCPVRKCGPEQSVTPENGAAVHWATCILPPSADEGLPSHGQSREKRPVLLAGFPLAPALPRGPVWGGRSLACLPTYSWDESLGWRKPYLPLAQPPTWRRATEARGDPGTSPFHSAFVRPDPPRPPGPGPGLRSPPAPSGGSVR